MVGRLIFAIVSTLVEEAALALIVLWGLPTIGIHIPLAGLVVLMIAWGVFSVVSFALVTRSLKRQPLPGLPNMVGSHGEVITSLTPDGLVRIKGELWVAESASSQIKSGARVIVVKQDRLKLVVRERSSTDDSTRQP